MNYSVKVRRVIENGKPLKATCSVTMDDQFTVHGVKVIQNEKGRFIAMPSEAYKDNDGMQSVRLQASLRSLSAAYSFSAA